MTEDKGMRIEVEEKVLEYDSGIKLSEIAKNVYGENHGKLLAKVNGKLKELWKKVSEDAKVSFYDITSTDGIRTYERGVLFLFIKSVHDVFGKSEVTGVNCEYSLGNGIFCEIRGNAKINDEFVYNTVTSEKFLKILIDSIESDLGYNNKKLQSHFINSVVNLAYYNSDKSITKKNFKEKFYKEALKSAKPIR